MQIRVKLISTELFGKKVAGLPPVLQERLPDIYQSITQYDTGYLSKSRGAHTDKIDGFCDCFSIRHCHFFKQDGTETDKENQAKYDGYLIWYIENVLTPGLLLKYEELAKKEEVENKICLLDITETHKGFDYASAVPLIDMAIENKDYWGGMMVQDSDSYKEANGEFIDSLIKMNKTPSSRPISFGQAYKDKILYLNWGRAERMISEEAVKLGYKVEINKSS